MPDVSPIRRRPLRTAAAVLLAASAALALGAGPIPPDTDPVEFEKAARNILCDCGCNPQSTYDCACGRAAEMRDEIAAMIREGRSGEDVIEAYVAAKGEQIRVAPTATGFNLVAWLGPAVLFLAATVGVVLVLRRWRRTAPAAPGGNAPPPTVDPDDPYLERLKGELEKYP